jgi:DNA polymerase-3 subunit delta
MLLIISKVTCLQLASPEPFWRASIIEGFIAVEKCNDAFLDDALAYLEAPESDVVVCCCAMVVETEARSCLDAHQGRGFSGAGRGVQRNQEGCRTSVTFVNQEFQRHSVTIEPKAARALVDAFSSDLV